VIGNRAGVVERLKKARLKLCSCLSKEQQKRKKKKKARFITQQLHLQRKKKREKFSRNIETRRKTPIDQG
jgi:hypothetical protein